MLMTGFDDNNRKPDSIVAERIFGRRLRPNEYLVHKNRISTDNRPENLEIGRFGIERRFVRSYSKDDSFLST